MRFKIIHETEYSFNSEVFLEPHYLRFKAKTTAHIVLESFNIQLSPNPAGLSELIDPENNLIHICWFDGTTTKLHLKVESIVKTEEYNPFNFLIYPPDYFNLPFVYPEALKNLLQPALNAVTLSNTLIEYGEDVKKEFDYNTMQVISNLTKRIHLDHVVENRHKGIPFNPDKTFEQKKGSCRDLAWMQIMLLRQMGIATRFVSGYYYVDVEKPEFELHAWIEVFLPGAGWIGFDPSNGIAAGHTHIPIAASAQFENTMPVTGTTRGDALPTLTTNLVIDHLG